MNSNFFLDFFPFYLSFCRDWRLACCKTSSFIYYIYRQWRLTRMTFALLSMMYLPSDSLLCCIFVTVMRVMKSPHKQT
ncbi:hypothetical protein BDW75DRAFT_202008 [Aspergillus navahoensis]